MGRGAGGDGDSHMNGVCFHVAAGKICSLSGDTVLMAVQVVVVPAAVAVGKCPGTGSVMAKCDTLLVVMNNSQEGV
jgi:hypothetical protein